MDFEGCSGGSLAVVVLDSKQLHWVKFWRQIVLFSTVVHTWSIAFHSDTISSHAAAR